MATESEPKYLFAKMVRGHPFPDAPMFPDENIEFTMDYVPLDGDIIIASYPKTGTTWLQYIVLQILSKGTSFPAFYDLKTKSSPFMEMAGKAAIESLKSPRVLTHHFAYNLVQKNMKSKVIYIYRRPEDTCISYCHFSKGIWQTDIDKNEFFEAFLKGWISYGSYFGHIRSYWEHKEDPNLLFVSYEKLKRNTREEILKIANFIDEEIYKVLSEDEDLLQKMIRSTSFENMKKELVIEHPVEHHKEAGVKVDFFRKGVVGDGKIEYTPEQLNRLNAVVKRELKGTRFADEWSDE